MFDSYHPRDTTSVLDVFFSLKGTLPRGQWCLAMIIATAIFHLGVSLLLAAGASEDVQPMLVLALWALAFVLTVSLLVAKRLLDIDRPVWLALSITVPGTLMVLGFLSGFRLTDVNSVLLAGYLGMFMIPALVACLRYEDDT